MDGTFVEPTLDQVRSLLRAMVGRRVLVVGDLMVDAYLTGRIDRISPEAPVPVFEIEHEQFMLGGAANVAKCLVALGAEVSLCGVVGDDAHGRLLRDEAVNLQIDAAGVIVDDHRPTTLKSRIVAQRQQVIRLDREHPGQVAADAQARLLAAVRAAAADADAVVLSDYAKGVLTDAVCRAAIDAARGPVIVDPKDLPWDRYRGATLIKPNRREAGWFHGSVLRDDGDAVEAATSMLSKLAVDHALITRGDQGMTLASSREVEARGARGGISHIPPIRREVFDATGAGDIVATVLALALAADADARDAAYLANVAGAVEVSKFGTAVVTDSEILEAIGDSTIAYERKVMSVAQAAALAEHHRRTGKRVVFTNGCFDILHVGHVNYLERSARLGDALIVGINTDASVRRLKGPGRPVQNQRDRAHIIASQACVDAVVLFDQDTPLELIEAVRPDVLTKGADYRSKENVVGWRIVERHGGQVVLIDLVEGRSTTQLIEKAAR